MLEDQIKKYIGKNMKVYGSEGVKQGFLQKLTPTHVYLKTDSGVIPILLSGISKVELLE